LTGKLLNHHEYICDVLRSYISDWISYIFPKDAAETSDADSTLRDLCKIYVSDLALSTMRQACAAASDATAAAVAAAEAAAYLDEDRPVGGVDGGAHLLVGGDSGAAAGVDDSAPETMTPAAFANMRASPRRLEPLHHSYSADNNAVDRIGALDDATVRAIVRFRFVMQIH